MWLPIQIKHHEPAEQFAPAVLRGNKYDVEYDPESLKIIITDKSP